MNVLISLIRSTTWSCHEHKVHTHIISFFLIDSLTLALIFFTKSVIMFHHIMMYGSCPNFVWLLIYWLSTNMQLNLVLDFKYMLKRYDYFIMSSVLYILPFPTRTYTSTDTQTRRHIHTHTSIPANFTIKGLLCLRNVSVSSSHAFYSDHVTEWKKRSSKI